MIEQLVTADGDVIVTSNGEDIIVNGALEESIDRMFTVPAAGFTYVVPKER